MTCAHIRITSKHMCEKFNAYREKIPGNDYLIVLFVDSSTVESLLTYLENVTSDFDRELEQRNKINLRDCWVNDNQSLTSIILTYDVCKAVVMF